MSNVQSTPFSYPVDLRQRSLTAWEELLDDMGVGSHYIPLIRKALYIDNINDLSQIDIEDEESRKRLLAHAYTSASKPLKPVHSQDRSIRLTLELHDGNRAETVLIPEWQNGVLQKCSASVSSQVGCFFGCSFCATGRMGFHRNLNTGELLDQIRLAERVAGSEFNSPLTHLYFMGMGEPLHNYRALSDALFVLREPGTPGPGPERVTVSTVGLYRQIRMLANEHPEVRLAVSVHSADQNVRQQIMPASARMGLAEIKTALQYHTRRTGNPVTIQYLLLDDINDTEKDARNLLAYLDSLPCRITLIMYNDVQGAETARSGAEHAGLFRRVLADAGLDTDIRWCHGEDIEAGCGQLRIAADTRRTRYSMRHPSPQIQSESA